MSRTKNSLPPVILKISTNEIVKGHLEALVSSGLWGATAPEVAEELIRLEIRRLIETEHLEKRKKNPKSS
jgi:hypothetical protein